MKRDLSNVAWVAGLWTSLILLVWIVAAFAQVPGQLPGQGPGPSQGPPPPFHIPHLGGPRQERPQSEASTEAPVYVVLWFDVEDYILPQSDDAGKRLAVFLTQEGIPATFKVVGEEARVLKQRQRQDVVTALAQHDIGYNTNTHSQHPTVAEYESNLGWDAGIDEFSRRERPGFDDVAHVFRKSPVAYGEPGNSWAPQVFPVLKKWGIVLNDASGRFVGLRGRPFWYGGVLNVGNTREGDLLRPDDNWSNLDSAKQRFQDAYVAMTARKSGGVISLHFCPCEFVNKEPWNVVNFANGANPPSDRWKQPGLKTPEESEKAFQYFENLVRFLKSFQRVQFLSATGAAARFRDRAQSHVFSPQEVRAIAGQVDSKVTFQAGDDFNLSASEVLYVINRFLVAMIERQGTNALILDKTPYGPDSATAPLTANLVIPWSQVRRTVLDVQDDLDKTGRIPSAIWLGSRSIPPESYLVGIARAAQSLLQNAEPPESITFAPARLAAAEYVADDSPDLWDWAIFPHGFHAPDLMSLAKLQAWTLKPAVK